MFNYVEYILDYFGKEGEGGRERKQAKQEGGRREKREGTGLVMGVGNDREKGRQTDHSFSA